MTEPEEPNLFIDLEIDPNQPWSQEIFEKALLSKRGEWGRHVNDPDNEKKAWARIMTARHSVYGKIAADEQQRKTQQEQAIVLLQKKQEERVEKLKELIRISAGKGYILKGQFNQWIKEYELSESQLRALIISVRVVDEPPANSSTREAKPLDKVRADRIAKNLKLLKKRDLYHFLGLPDNTPLETLRKHAEQLRNETIPKRNNDIENDIILELLGECKVIFGSEVERARYEETLRLSAFDFLKEHVDTAAGGGTVVTANQIDDLLREASKRKLDVDEALRFIQSCAAKKFTLVLPETLAPAIKRMRRCPSCSKMNAENAKACECGAILQESCPKCGGAVPTGYQACPQCSFPIGNRRYVELMLRESNQCYSDGRIPDADQKLKQIEPLWSGANDALGKRIETLRKAIDKANADALVEKTQQAAAVKEIEALRGQHKYYQVHRSIAEWKVKLKATPKEFENFHQQAKEEIARAESKVAAALEDRKQEEVDQAILKYQEALSICADCEEALLELKRTPPSPPISLAVTKVGERLVRLKWQASASPLVNYIVLRQKERSPNSPGDGERIATLSATEYDDAACKPGISYFYAVYAARAEVTSTESAKSSQPILLTEEVAGLVACPASEQVELNWTAPVEAYDIKVRRNLGPKFPESSDEGVAISVLGKERAIDQELCNGKTYSYTVFAVFKDIQNNPVVSKGAHVTAIPQPPPAIVSELYLTKVSDAPLVLEISWNPPDSVQTVAIIRSEKSLSFESGTVLPRTEIEKHGRVLASSGSSVRDEPGDIRACYYTPISIQQDTAYVGKEKRFVLVPDVTKLKAEKRDNIIRLTWEWPQNCAEVYGIVSHRNPAYPTTLPQKSSEFRIHIDHYRLKTCVEIAIVPGMDHIIDVFAVFSTGNECIQSSGLQVKVRSQQIHLSYWIKPKRFGQKPALVIQTEGIGQLPVLSLVYNAQRIPLHRDDGVCIMTIPPGELVQQKTKLTLTLPDDIYPQESVAILFLENDEYKDDVILYPRDGELRINK